MATDLRQIYEHATNNVVYPALLKEFGSLSWLANKLYWAMSHIWGEWYYEREIVDPEAPEEELGVLYDNPLYHFVVSWVERKFSILAINQ